MLLVAMACAGMVTGQDAFRQLLAIVAVIAVICWFVAAA
jgi:hypothetical protein